MQAHLGRTGKEAPIFPLGLMYLAAALDTRHEVKILDLNLWEHDRAFAMLQKHINDYKPDIAGLSIRNIDTTQRADRFFYFKTVRPTARLIKDTKPDTVVVFGGPGFSAFAHTIMERVPECDFGVFLEGEESTSELLDNLEAPERVRGIYFRRNGAVMFTGERPPPDFSSLPMPLRGPEIIDIKRYDDPNGSNIGIQSKRGCMLTCAYCNYPFLTGGRVRLRPPEKVVDEIEYLTSLGIKKFSFVDNVFNVPQSHAREICREIIRRRLDVQWNAWYEIKNTTRELVDLAQQAGCVHFGFSPDGATDRMLARLSKQITEKDIDRTVRIISRAHGARAGYNFFLLPGMSLRDLAKTLWFFVKIPLALRGRGRVFGLGWVRIMPHTRMLRAALREGIIREDEQLLPHNEKDLNRLFYCKRSALFFDYSIIYAFGCIEHYLKPLVKAVLGRNRKKIQEGGVPPVLR